MKPDNERSAQHGEVEGGPVGVARQLQKHSKCRKNSAMMNVQIMNEQ